jgi:hypothetical protein
MHFCCLNDGAYPPRALQHFGSLRLTSYGAPEEDAGLFGRGRKPIYGAVNSQQRDGMLAAHLSAPILSIVATLRTLQD